MLSLNVDEELLQKIILLVRFSGSYAKYLPILQDRNHRDMYKTLLILLGILCCCLSCQPQIEQSFVTSDVDNFWQAYDKIVTTEDTTLQMQFLQELFLDPGSEGLASFQQVRRYQAKEYLEAIRQYPKFWNSLRANTEHIDQHFPEIDKYITQLKDWYPELKPATIYFLIGVFRSNGTILKDQVLIGSEMALVNKAVEIEELPEHPKTFFTKHNPSDDLPFLCTHEYVHTQQKEFVDYLLAYCVYEGIAEFIATVVTGKKSYLSAIAYGEEHYEQVRDKFEEDMYLSYRTFQWLWSTNTIFGERDLGYAVGYGMAKRFFDQAEDQEQAVKTMIELDYSNEEDLLAFVDASGYLSQPIQELYEQYERSRPVVSKISGIENGSKTVRPGTQAITIHFSEALNGHNTGVDYGELGKEAFPKLSFDRIWAADNQSWTITAELEANRHYQILISNNFRLENGVQLKPFLIEFWTGD